MTEITATAVEKSDFANHVRRLYIITKYKLNPKVMSLFTGLINAELLLMKSYSVYTGN